MRMVYETPYVKLYRGDSRHLPLEDGTVSCVVTSPPFLGLRKYAGDQDLIWDEPAEGCEHVWSEYIQPRRGGVGDYEVGRVGDALARQDSHKEQISSFCQRCGAWRGAFGLEPHPDLYIRHLMVFMDELWRVLRGDGCVFVNLGDSMAGSNNGSNDYRERGASISSNPLKYGGQKPGRAVGIRPKSLMLIPERFALACQERGWIVRSRIVWAKPNPMPESVTDRPTDAWEHIWMLTKSERYYWDQEAVREPLSAATLADSRNDTGRHPYQNSKHDAKDRKDKASWERAKTFVNPEQGRNLRNVWTINTEGFPGAHFAVFPSAIPERCILAACPPAICSACGKPRERIVEHIPLRVIAKGMDNPMPKHRLREEMGLQSKGSGLSSSNSHNETTPRSPINTTLGWSDCGCGAGWTPGLVLDPFSGSGTTAMVAQQLGRRAVCVDLSAEYIEMARRRLESVPLPMALEA